MAKDNNNLEVLFRFLFLVGRSWFLVLEVLVVAISSGVFGV
jgi:hypothetical protein